ncbi:zeta toxin family protein [Candidatus Margulisiibacteriota bacterium]
MAEKKEVHIVGGPNGAGKTTFVKHFLPEYVNVTNFVNADDIAVGLSPFDRNAMPIKSGKIMLELIDQYKEKGESFGFETTLAGQKWKKMIQEMKQAGYSVFLFFLDLSSVDLAVARVKYRVESGGHEIPEETIRRRYVRSRHNFWYNYKDQADGWYLFNNSGSKPELIANTVKKSLNVVNKKYLEFFLAATEGKND